MIILGILMGFSALAAGFLCLDVVYKTRQWGGAEPADIAFFLMFLGFCVTSALIAIACFVEAL